MKDNENYKEDAWKQYSIEELAQWVSLLTKRATHRSNKGKAEKDIADARAYLDMLEQKI